MMWVEKSIQLHIPSIDQLLQATARHQVNALPARNVMVGGYTACRIPLVQSANGNGNRIPLNGILFNRVPLNAIPFNGIPFPFVSVKKMFESSVSVRFR